MDLRHAVFLEMAIRYFCCCVAALQFPILELAVQYLWHCIVHCRFIELAKIYLCHYRFPELVPRTGSQNRQCNIFGTIVVALQVHRTGSNISLALYCALQIPRTGSAISVAPYCIQQVPRTGSKIYVALCCSTTGS